MIPGNLNPQRPHNKVLLSLSRKSAAIYAKPLYVYPLLWVTTENLVLLREVIPLVKRKHYVTK